MSRFGLALHKNRPTRAPTKRKGKMMIKLQKGDYVATADIKDEAEYHAIARAFHKAGAEQYGDDDKYKEWPNVGWHNGKFMGMGENSDCKRQLTPAQVLATPQWVPEVGCQYTNGHEEVVEVVAHWNDKAVYIEVETGEAGIDEYYNLSPLPTEEDRAVEEMMQASGVMVASLALRDIYRAIRDGKITGIALTDKQPQPAVDMSDPANWRAGDVVEVIEKDIGGYHCGFSTPGALKVVNSNDNQMIMLSDSKYPEGITFYYDECRAGLRFHSRP